MTEETCPASELTVSAPVSGWRAAFSPAQWLTHDAIARRER